MATINYIELYILVLDIYDCVCIWNYIFYI